jgi:hypothetical protein
MENDLCPNISTCRLVTTDIVVPQKDVKQQYLKEWCNKDKDIWGDCKRYNTKKVLSFCPDFVLPDTLLSVDEIIDKFDAEI